MTPRLSYRHLLPGALLAIWCAALSGVALPLSPQTMLLLHLVSSFGGVVPVALFLSHHWWSRRDKIARHPNAIQGYIALASLCLLGLSGLALLRWTNVPALRWLHTSAMAVLLLDLTFHMAWRLRRRRIGPRPHPLSLAAKRAGGEGRSRSIRNWGLVGLIAAGLVGGLALVSRESTAQTQATTIPVQHASLGTGTLFAAQDCSPCHSEITQQWRRSGHAHAATEPYYQAVATLLIEERGVEAARFCAACHNPVGLMQGEVDASAPQRVEGESGPAYQARKLGIALPISARAAEGVTCGMCHQATHVAESPSNGSLKLDIHASVLPTDALSRLSLRAVPAAHRDTLLRPVIQQAELCGSCHNLYLPDTGLALEPTFDEWKNSPYPSQGITCQSCHLAPRPASRADSGLSQAIVAHGVTPGAPSSLPGLADDIALLQKAATLTVSGTISPSDPSVLMATVTITNSGAGHELPTGASDLRQVWLEVTLRDAAGQAVWSSGTLDQYGKLDPTAVQFHKVLGDANGRPIALHRVWVATQVLENTSLRPMETRRIPYRIALPSAAQAPFTLTVRLLYQDVSQSFAEFALERALPAHSVPVREMARTDIVVGK